MAGIPFCDTVSNHINRLLRRVNSRTVFPHPLNQLMKPVKGSLGLGTDHIARSCSKSYLGQTVRMIEVSCKEHQRRLQLGQDEKSALAAQDLIFRYIKIVWSEEVTCEALEIHLEVSSLNHEDGLLASLELVAHLPCGERRVSENAF